MKPELRAVLASVFDVDAESLNDETDIKSEPRWDSLNHMTLLFALEDEFGIQFSDQELPSLTSVVAIERALAAHGR